MKTRKQLRKAVRKMSRPGTKRRSKDNNLLALVEFNNYKKQR